jgi:hypothetical protein
MDWQRAIRRHAQAFWSIRPQRFFAVLQRNDAIADIAQIVGAALDGDARLGGEQFAQRRLGPLDFAGKDGLATDKGAHEHMRIGQSPAFSGELADQPVGVRQQSHQPGRPVKSGRQWIRHEGGVTALRNLFSRNPRRFWHRNRIARTAISANR